jgi:Zn-dependent metalloprotease
MIAALVLAATLSAPHEVASFKAAFPGASVIESPTGRTMTNASGFETAPLATTPVAAARRFLAKYGAAFGVTYGEELVVRASPQRGETGPVRFERRRRGMPIFDADIVIGVTGTNCVMLVNGSELPANVSGRSRISRRAAVRTAAREAPGNHSEGARATLGWRASLQTLRPVWRVEFTAEQGGEWRAFVDADTGKVLLRVSTRDETRRFGGP